MYSWLLSIIFLSYRESKAMISIIENMGSRGFDLGNVHRDRQYMASCRTFRWLDNGRAGRRWHTRYQWLEYLLSFRPPAKPMEPVAASSPPLLRCSKSWYCPQPSSLKFLPNLSHKYIVYFKTPLRLLFTVHLHKHIIISLCYTSPRQYLGWRNERTANGRGRATTVQMGWAPSAIMSQVRKRYWLTM